MGMFDYVDYEMPCPKCGALLKEFQSKDAGCWLEIVKLSEVSNFYTSCRNCGEWVEFTLKRPENITIADFVMEHHPLVSSPQPNKEGGK